MIKTLRKFFAFCRREDRNRFIVSLVFGFFEAVSQAMVISSIGYAMMKILNNNIELSDSFIALGIILGGILLDTICKYFSVIKQTEGGYYTACYKRIEIAEHLRYLPMGYFNDNSLGTITSITTNAMETLGDVATRVVLSVTKGLLNTSVIIILLFVYDYRIGLIALSGFILFLIVNSILQKKAINESKEKVDSDESLINEVVDYVQGISEVKSFNLNGSKSKKLNKAILKNANANFNCERKFVPYMALQQYLTKLIGVAITISSIAFYIQGTMELLTCIMMIICSFMVFMQLEAGGNFSALLKTVEICVDKANSVLEVEPMNIAGRDITPKSFDIEAKNISFSYEKKRIINNVSFNIKNKTTTAIVGPSGSGKTTIANLIARFWDVDSGDIKIDGVNIKDYSIDSLMMSFSFVFQRVYLFEDSILNNVKFGNEAATKEEVIEACKKACCHDFITKLPNGYDTIIGEGGASLSGGEKQRLSIARAILKDSPIIILDEATANVDPENEKNLMDAIEALTKEKTIIMIAHRLKTVKNADQILVVDNGQIVNRGTHDYLMSIDGIYKNFVEARMKAVSWKI